MLEELLVNNVGSVKKASLEFKGNFIAITGESGTGKSSLIKSLEFITGQRAQVGIINSEETSCDVAILLSVDELANTDNLYKPEDGTIVVRRIFNSLGKGKCSVQGIIVPISTLHTILKDEIVIQNQFAQLGLLDPTKQLNILDSSSLDISLVQNIDTLSSQLNELIILEKTIIKKKKQQRDLEEKYQNSEKILSEIKKLFLNENSEELLNKELSLLESKNKEISRIKNILFQISPSQDGNIYEKIGYISRELSSIDTTEDKRVKTLAETAFISIQTLTLELEHILKNYSTFSEIEELKDKIEEKIGKIRQVKRKLNLNSCSDLINYYKQAESDIEWIKNSHNNIDIDEKSSSILKKNIAKLAFDIREERKILAKKLSEKVNKHLHDMAMEYAIFSVEINELDRITSHGAENISFNISINGQNPLPIHKNASGGELSRILLALQLSLNENNLPNTIIFDEVESGLGGKTALLAGYKLMELSKKCRTILITHEATIAAMSDQHFIVRKNEEGLSCVHEITGKDREEEIARMLSGDETSEEALNHAKYLLENPTSISFDI
ncbi:MAG: AAA family ATPase [Synergistaceae bacterium]